MPPWWLAISMIIVVLVGIGIMSSSLVHHLQWWWSREEGSHGWLVPIITAFVLWQRRHRIALVRSDPSWWGTVLFGLGLAIFMMDDLGQFQRFSVPALIIMALGVALATLGWRAARYAAVPIAFLAFAMAPPGGLYVWLSLQLQFLSSEIGAAILQLLGISVFLDGNVIDLGVYKLQVAEACSGLRYLFPLMSLAFLCAWMYRAPLWARASVLVSVVPITILTNSVRIALVGVFVEYGSIARAEGFMHLFEGWVVFLVAMAMLFALMWLMAVLRGDRNGLSGLLDADRLAGIHIPTPPSAPSPPRPTRALLSGPWLACVAIVVAGTVAHIFIADRHQFIVERPGLATFPLKIGEWRGQPATIDARTEAVLGATDYFLADFATGDESAIVNLWVTYFKEQVKNAAIHSPENCLPGAGWEFARLETIRSPISNHEGEPFQLKRAVVTNNQTSMLLYYWLEARGQQFLTGTMLKYGNLWSSVVEGRSDGGLVRLITPIQAGESIEAAEARVVAFMEVAYPEMEPHLGR